jgi:hypothetical protein
VESDTPGHVLIEGFSVKNPPVCLVGNQRLKGFEGVLGIRSFFVDK